MTRQVSTLNVLIAHSNQSNQDKQRHGIYRLITIDKHDTIRINMRGSMACTGYSRYEHDDTSTSMQGGRRLRSHGPTYFARRLSRNHQLTIVIIAWPHGAWSLPVIIAWPHKDQPTSLLIEPGLLSFRLLLLLTHSVTYYELCPWPRTRLSIDYTLCRG